MTYQDDSTPDDVTSKWKSKLHMLTKRANWAIVIGIQMVVGQGIGWWWCIDKWAIESTYHIAVPGIGTTASLLGFHMITSIALLFIAWAIEYKNMRSMRYFHIEHVYKDNEEPRYGIDGAEVEDDLDAEDLDREKWFAQPYDPEYINIDRDDLDVLFNNERGPNTKTLTDDQITTILDKYVPKYVEVEVDDDGKTKAALGRYVPAEDLADVSADGATVPDEVPAGPPVKPKKTKRVLIPPEKQRDFVQLGHEPAGLPAYCYYVTYNRPAYHAPIGQRDVKPSSFMDCIEICHVPWDREFRFRRRTIPGRGFNVKCPNTERKELAHVDTLVGNLMVFVVTTSSYVRKEATRKIRPTDDVLTGIMMKILTFLYNLRMKDLKWKDDLIDAMRSENVSRNNAVRNARLDVLVNMNPKQYREDYERQIQRGSMRQQYVANNDTAITLGILSALLGAGFVILLIMRLAGV